MIVISINKMSVLLSGGSAWLLNRMHTAMLMGLVLMLAACSSLEGNKPSSGMADPGKPVSVQMRKPKIAVALGGGAARGFAHIGVLKVLEANGIVPDIIVGTSAGSVVGAIYASGLSPADMQRTAIGLDEAALGDWSMSSKGVIRGEALQNLVNKLVNQRPIEKLPRKFAATAVELNSGRLAIFERGNTGMAVRASSSVPGVFQPTSISGIDYVDGGVITPVPVRVARRLGADIVIAVDISAKPSALKNPGAIDIAMQSVTILGETVAAFETAEADVLIRPRVGHISSSDFASRNLLVLEGEQATTQAMVTIKDKIANFR